MPSVWIETIRDPIRYRWKDGHIILQPGKPICVSSTLGHRVLEKCRGKVRLVEKTLTPEPGLWVSFRSPLFGDCVAQIKEVLTKRIILTNHSVLTTDEGIAIQPSWISRIFQDASQEGIRS